MRLLKFFFSCLGKILYLLEEAGGGARKGLESHAHSMANCSRIFPHFDKILRERVGAWMVTSNVHLVITTPFSFRSCSWKSSCATWPKYERNICTKRRRHKIWGLFLRHRLTWNSAFCQDVVTCVTFIKRLVGKSVRRSCLKCQSSPRSSTQAPAWVEGRGGRLTFQATRSQGQGNGEGDTFPCDLLWRVVLFFYCWAKK